MDLEFTEGMQFDKGYISPYMVTDQERMEATLEDPYVLIANQKIGSVRDILPVLEQVIQPGKPLLIIARAARRRRVAAGTGGARRWAGAQGRVSRGPLRCRLARGRQGGGASV